MVVARQPVSVLLVVADDRVLAIRPAKATLACRIGPEAPPELLANGTQLIEVLPRAEYGEQHRPARPAFPQGAGRRHRVNAGLHPPGGRLLLGRLRHLRPRAACRLQPSGSPGSTTTCSARPTGSPTACPPKVNRPTSSGPWTCSARMWPRPGRTSALAPSASGSRRTGSDPRRTLTVDRLAAAIHAAVSDPAMRSLPVGTTRRLPATPSRPAGHAGRDRWRIAAPRPGPGSTGMIRPARNRTDPCWAEVPGRPLSRGGFPGLSPTLRPEEDAGFLLRRDGTGQPRCYGAAGPGSL